MIFILEELMPINSLAYNAYASKTSLNQNYLIIIIIYNRQPAKRATNKALNRYGRSKIRNIKIKVTYKDR